MKYFIGKTGNVNFTDGYEIYLYNNEKLASIKLYNFDLLSTVQKDLFELLPDEPVLNSQNCLVALSLEVNQKYRNKKYGTSLTNIAFEECTKLGVSYFLGYRYVDNDFSKVFWDKLGVKELISNNKISIILKKL
jgi:hypothetical protein